MPRPDPVRHFRARFTALGDPARAKSERAYMKTELRLHGVNAAQLRTECRAFVKEHPLDASTLRSIVDALFATEWFDLRTAAIALLEKDYALLSPKDLPWLIDLVRAGSCWAHVDFLATQVIDPLIVEYPALLARTRAWAKDDDFWVRRTALLAQLRALRGGSGDFALFTALAVPMLDEKEFFIRKAIGWVLREVSKKRPELVRDFMLAHGARASGLTRREATKYLPAAMLRALEDAPVAREATKKTASKANRAPRSPGSRRESTPRAPASSRRTPR